MLSPNPLKLSQNPSGAGQALSQSTKCSLCMKYNASKVKAKSGSLSQFKTNRDGNMQRVMACVCLWDSIYITTSVCVSHPNGSSVLTSLCTKGPCPLVHIIMTDALKFKSLIELTQIFTLFKATFTIGLAPTPYRDNGDSLMIYGERMSSGIKSNALIKWSVLSTVIPPPTQ